MKDYYYILGVKSTATLDDIKKAYRKLSMKFHPDRNDGDEFFTERFKDIVEAYETLNDVLNEKDMIVKMLQIYRVLHKRIEITFHLK